MNDCDGMNDNDVLCAVRDSLSGVPMPSPPRLEAIVARGRASRRRRQVGLSVAGVASGAALVLGLHGVIGSGSPAPARSDSNSQADVRAFTVVSDPNGTTTLTLNLPGGLIDPDAVRQALEQHGIPALVTVGKLCTTAVRPDATGFISVQPPPDGSPSGSTIVRSADTPGSPKKVAIVFNPSAMPAGSEVSIGYRQDSQGRQISVRLIEAGAPLTCSTIPGSNPPGGPS